MAAPPAAESENLASRWEALAADLGESVATPLDRRLGVLAHGPSPSVSFARNLILYGPPGTGKTFVARKIAMALTGEEPGPDNRSRIVQFHPSYSYEDFVQGYRPALEGGQSGYKLVKGPFCQLCESAEDDPARFYVLLIDEINRGDPARIFGELLYGLEYRDEAIELALGGELRVPSNLVVVGTMNSVDRSVALVDYALRRRFGFVRISADPEIIVEERKGEPGAPMAAERLERLNRWLTKRLDVDHTVGHSFFLNRVHSLSGSQDVDMVFDMDIFPLLEEYFHGELDMLREARTIWSAPAKSSSS